MAELGASTSAGEPIRRASSTPSSVLPDPGGATKWVRRGGGGGGGAAAAFGAVALEGLEGQLLVAAPGAGEAKAGEGSGGRVSRRGRRPRRGASRGRPAGSSRPGSDRSPRAASRSAPC